VNDGTLISLDRQIEICKQAVKVGGSQISTVYVDRGTSGRVEARDALRALMEDAKHRRVDRLGVKNLDRLSRSPIDAIQIVEILREYGVAVYCVDGDRLSSVPALFPEVSPPLRTARKTRRRREAPGVL
jgi:DNA invertase Pin-like site-specific DNA recombinase